MNTMMIVMTATLIMMITTTVGYIDNDGEEKLGIF